jgi:hypothetical protein
MGFFLPYSFSRAPWDLGQQFSWSHLASISCFHRCLDLPHVQSFVCTWTWDTVPPPWAWGSSCWGWEQGAGICFRRPQHALKTAPSSKTFSLLHPEDASLAHPGERGSHCSATASLSANASPYSILHAVLMWNSSMVYLFLYFFPDHFLEAPTQVVLLHGM